MIYKTHKDVYKSVADRLGVDYSIVRSISDFYWGDISKRIANFDNRELYVNKLGVFRFRKLLSVNYIENSKKTEKFMRRLGRSEEVIQKTMEDLEVKKEKMQKLIDEWNYIVNEGRKYREKKYAYRNIQEQKANLGGSQEPSVQG